MTTYYGVWNEGYTWWFDKNKERIFYTAVRELARAQAAYANDVSNEDVTGLHWEARTIGEDGLPVPNPTGDAANDRMTEALGLGHIPESHLCAMCGQPATEYVDVHIKGWMCERHKVVKVGCVENESDEYLLDERGRWVKELRRQEP